METVSTQTKKTKKAKKNYYKPKEEHIGYWLRLAEIIGSTQSNKSVTSDGEKLPSIKSEQQQRWRFVVNYPELKE